MQSFSSLSTLNIEENGNKDYTTNILASQNGSISEMFSISTKDRSTNPLNKGKKKNAKISHKKHSTNIIATFPWMMITKLIVTLSFIAVAVVLKFFYVRSHVSPKMELARLAANSIDQYIHTLSVNLAMLELLNWDNQSEIQYMSPLRFYYKKAEAFRSRVIAYYDTVLADPQGPNFDLASRLLNAEICQVFQKADFYSEEYPNCAISLAGQAKNPLIFFLRQYLNLLDRFMSEWQLSKTYQERLALIERDEYSSIIAYASHDQYGTADAMFYHVLLPISTRLTDRIDELTSYVSLSNVIFTVVVLALSATLFRWAYAEFVLMQESFWSIVKSVPYHLVQSNLILKNRIKQAYLHKFRFAPF
jgi:hypothetical protein